MAVTSRHPRVAGLAVAAGLLLHVVQVLVFGHDLVSLLDGHGLEALPGLLLAPPPMVLVGALTVGFGLAVLVVLLARATGGAPRWLPAENPAPARYTSGVRCASQTLGARRHGRAPPDLLT